MMKKSLCMLALAVLSGLWTADAWASWPSSHSKHTGTISVQSTGNGTVYVASSSTATSGSSSGSVDCGSNESGDNNTKDYWLFATANAGYHFAGWSESSGGSIVSTDNPLKYTIKVNNNVTRYASFEKNPAVSVSFETPANGSFAITVGGETRPDYSAIETSDEITLTATPADGYRVYGWYTASGGSRTYFAYGNATKYIAMSATTIGVEFIAESEVVKVSDLAGLTAALSGASRVVEIPAGTNILVSSGTTLTIPVGKKVTLCNKPAKDINGNEYTNYAHLAVVGGIDIKGGLDGTGKLLKVSQIVTQGPVITPSNTYTNFTKFGMWRGEQGITTETSCKYRDTKTEYNKATVTGTPSCMVGWGAYANDSIIAEIAKEKPKALVVSFDTSVAINSISSINGISDGLTSSSSQWCSSQCFVLLEDFTIAGPIYEEKTSSGSKYNRIRYQGTTDCAGYNCTMSSYEVSSQTDCKMVNGGFAYTGSYWQQGDAAFIHCTSASWSCIKGTGNIFYFVDCGSATKPAKLTFSFYQGVSDSNCRRAWIYSGYYDYSFSKSYDNASNLRKCYVYGGSFSSNPAELDGDETKAALGTGLIVKNEGGRYVVYEEEVKKEIVQIGTDGEKYESLQDAFNAASDGQCLYLQGNVEIEGTVTNGNKTLTVELNGRSISGGAIVNTGKLRFEDNSSGDVRGSLSSSITNNGEGEIDFTLGTYACPVTVNGGRVATHGGTFTADFVITKNAGTLQLRGGTFSSDVSTMLEEGYHRDEERRVGPYLQSGMTQDSSAYGSMDVSYKVTAMLPEKNNNLLVGFKKNKVTERGKYSDADWDLLQEILSTYETYNTDILECVLTFDRTVEVGTVMGYGEANGYSKSFVLDQTMQGGISYRLITPQFGASGYTVPPYRYYFDGQFSDLRCGVKNTDKNGKRSLANIGTTCTLKAVLWPTSYDNYRLTLATRTYKFTGKGAICGSTDYTSLSAALLAASYSGTVKLSKDCSEAIVVSRVATFTVDANNFAFTGSIAAGDGYQVATSELGDGRTQYAVTVVSRKVSVTKPEDGSVASVRIKGEGELTADDDGFYSVPSGKTIVVAYVADAEGYEIAEQEFAVTGDMTVPAPGAATPITYAITYVDGGESSNPATYTVEDVVVLAAATKADYNFRGWFADAEYTTAVTQIAVGSTGEKTFYAKWEHVPVVLTVVKPAHASVESVVVDGVMLKDVEGTYSVPYGKSVTVTYAPDAGYSMAEKVHVFDNVTAAREIAAPETTVNVYSIAYENYDGTRTAADASYPTSYDVSADDITIPALTKAGYDFNGWYEDDKFTKKAGVVTIPQGSTGHRKFYASWLSNDPEAAKAVEGETLGGGTTAVAVRVPDNWITNAVGVGATETQIEEKLQEKADNGLKIWQNFVLDTAGVTDKKTEITIATNETSATALDVTLKLETTEAVTKIAIVKVESASDATVKEIVASKETAASGKVGKKEAEVAVNYADLDAGIYCTAVEVDSTLIPDVKATAVQIVKNKKKAAKTVLTVPFAQSLVGTNVTVASLVDTSALAADDIIRVYNKKTGKFEGWSYKGDGTWRPMKNGADTPADATTIALEPGQAVILDRSNSASTNNAITMVGQYNAATEVKTEIEWPKDGEKEAWNLVGNADQEGAFDLNRIESANANDQVVVPTDGLPKQYSRKSDGTWFYTTNAVRAVKFGNQVKYSAYTVTVTNSTVDAGEGFWYVSGGGNKKTVIDWKAK